MTAEYVEVTITARSTVWLLGLAHDLIDARLASSAHVMPVKSVYRWDGEIKQADEARAFLRSRLVHVDAIVAFVKERHPYEVPNITALPIIGGNPDYLDWITDETVPGPSGRAPVEPPSGWLPRRGFKR